MQRKKKNEGFTLIEIIAVLLVLAVLAAVAVPRYLTLVEDARVRALDGALAAGYSQLSLTFAQLSLQEGEAPDADTLAAAAEANPPEGDFTFAFSADGDVITVTVSNDEGNERQGEWTLP